MTQLATSAPGKVLVLGEYAVTEGASALVVSVNRSARVEIEPLDSEDSILHAPDIHAEPLQFRITERGVQWQTTAPRNLGLFEMIMQDFASAVPVLAKPGAIRLSFCTRDFFDHAGKTKLGLGSSAALTVALQRALHRHFLDPQNDQSRQRQFLQALDAHRRFQGGLGSGVDIAASVVGGVLRFRSSQDRQLNARSLKWPDALEYCLVSSGRSASTQLMLTDLGRWRESHPRQYETHISRLSELAECGAEAFEKRRISDFLETVAGFAEAMKGLGEMADINIFSAEHRRLATLAKCNQVIYKPSGAGGGDFGLALGTDASAMSAFRKDCEAAGHHCPPIQFET
jgi:phosphomevalonate kinase